MIVATIRALKYNGGVAKADLGNENLEALEKGMPNLLKHVSNITNVYKLPCVVAINRFPLDTEAELKLVEDKCRELGVNVALSEVWAKGGEGGIALAEEVIRLCEQPNDFTFAYELDATIEEKITAIVQKIYGQAQGDLGGGDGVAPVGDVGEGAAVDKGGGVLQGLDQVGLEGVLEQGGHSALGVQIAGGDGLLVVGVAHHQTGQTVLQIGDVAGQAQHGHDLAGHGDVVAVLTGHAVDPAAQTVGDKAELAVIHVHAAAPGDPAGVNAQLVALVNMVIQHGGQQVVGSADGVEVAGKVEVDVLHRNDLSITAAGSAALDAEDGSQGGLPQGDQNVLAQLLHAVGQTDGSGGLALAGGGGVDGGDQNQLAGTLSGLVEDVVVHLGLVVAVLLQILGVHAGSLGDLGDVLHSGLLGDLDVRFEAHVFHVSFLRPPRPSGSLWSQAGWAF
mgnify:CR=1 FL=1